MQKCVSVTVGLPARTAWYIHPRIYEYMIFHPCFDQKILVLWVQSSQAYIPDGLVFAHVTMSKARSGRKPERWPARIWGHCQFCPAAPQSCPCSAGFQDQVPLGGCLPFLWERFRPCPPFVLPCHPISVAHTSCKPNWNQIKSDRKCWLSPS